MNEIVEITEFDTRGISLEQAAFLIGVNLDNLDEEVDFDSLQRESCVAISVIKPHNFTLGGDDYTFESRKTTESNSAHRVLLRDDRSKDTDHDFVVLTPHCCGVPWKGYQEHDTKGYINGKEEDLTLLLDGLLDEYPKHET